MQRQLRQLRQNVQDKKIQRKVHSDFKVGAESAPRQEIQRKMQTVQRQLRQNVQDKKIQRKVHSEPGPVFQDKKIQRNSRGILVRDIWSLVSTLVATHLDT